MEVSISLIISSFHNQSLSHLCHKPNSFDPKMPHKSLDQISTKKRLETFTGNQISSQCLQSKISLKHLHREMPRVTGHQIKGNIKGALKCQSTVLHIATPNSISLINIWTQTLLMVKPIITILALLKIRIQLQRPACLPQAYLEYKDNKLIPSFLST